MDEQRQTRDKAKIPPVRHGLTVLVQEGKIMEKRITKRWWMMVTLALVALAAVTAAQQKAKKDLDVQLKAASQKELVDGDPKGAIALYQTIVDNAEANHAAAAKALLEMGRLYGRLGKAEDAKKAYDRVLKDYSDQKEVVSVARTRLGGDVRSTSKAIVLSKIWTGNTPGADHTVMAISPDGRYLVTASKTGLLIHDVSSEKDRYLRSTPSPSDGGIAFPCFTPDGKRVVYEIGKDGVHEIRSINTDGTDERTILKSSEYSSFELSAISPDGKLAAVNLVPAGSARSASNRSFWQVGLVSLQTGKLNILTGGWRDTYVGNFSPDGRWLAYASEVSGEGQDSAIYAIAVDGSVKNTLVSQEMTLNTPFFSPDGSKVLSVFAPGGAHRSDLYSIPVADGKKLGPPEIVREDLPSGFPDVMGMTKDGTLYLSKVEDQNSIYVAEVDASTWKLKTLPKEVSDPSRHEYVVEPAWSPNGKLLAFVDSANEKKLVIQDFDSRKERELSTHLTQMSFRGWMPDGKSILLTGPPTGVRLFDTETQLERSLSLMITGPVISSSDGKYLFYFRGDDTRTVGQTPADIPIQLIRRDLQTGDEKELYRFEGWRPSVMLAASPDGRNLSFAYAVASKPYLRTFWVLPLSGSEPRPRRLEGLGWEAGERVAFAWTQDAKAVLFVRSKNEIWVQPVDGGQAYRTGIRMDGLDSLGLDSPSVHPDGTRIAFVAHKQSASVWKLQNLFPQISATK